jgi:hypothetical protein
MTLSTSVCLLSMLTHLAPNMHFINAQLLAHGFAHSGGLSVDGLAVQDMEKLTKCLISMLGQRTVRGPLCTRMGS